ncbi:hypothetical protein [Streptomyces sp. NPDC005438]|uniref:hypothetical protein n=1 Tax=Streptomyces sp. NPDC005438 TaxID=3156880 RepID=UPI0033BF7807
MAHNPQAPQGPQGEDPAGNTQMFRAFVDEGGTPDPGPTAQSGPRTGLIVGVVAVVVVLVLVGWLAFG